MFPTWLDPEDALSRREMPHLSYTLSTNDGGKTWVSASSSLLGHITRFRLTPDGRGLGLKEYADPFKYPSEVYQIDWKTGKSDTVFRDKRYAITDVARDGALRPGSAVMPGRVRSYMPRRVKVFALDLKGMGRCR
jgi:hypothetical protein